MRIKERRHRNTSPPWSGGGLTAAVFGSRQDEAAGPPYVLLTICQVWKRAEIYILAVSFSFCTATRCTCDFTSPLLAPSLVTGLTTHPSRSVDDKPREVTRSRSWKHPSRQSGFFIRTIASPSTTCAELRQLLYRRAPQTDRSAPHSLSIQIKMNGEAILCYTWGAVLSSYTSFYFTTPVFFCVVWFAALGWAASVFTPSDFATVIFADPLLSCLFFSCLTMPPVLPVLRWWTAVVVFRRKGAFPWGRWGSSPILTVRLV